MIVIAASVWWMVRYDAFHYLSSGFITVYKSGLLEQSSFGGRIKFWVYFWDLVKERPVTGYGPSKGFFKYAVADNNYLFIAFKYGFVGLFLTMLIWSYLLIKAARSAFRSGAGSAMFLTFLVLGILFTSAFAETMDSMRLAPLAFLLSGFVLAHPTWADRSVRVGLFHKIVA
jgi:O-antigen ligase